MTDDTKLIFEKLEDIHSKIAVVSENQQAMEERLTKRQQVMDKKLTELQLTIENEISKKIDIIAEGHLDLTRKLDDALKVENEKEVLLLRVTSLENEVRRLKSKTEHIA